jgi:hypothetical protein
MNNTIGSRLYLIASYLLIVFAAFFTLMLLFVLPFAFAEPALLFGFFILTGVVLYSFSSFQFIKKGLEKGQILKARHKDFIKVNGYVVFFFVIQSFVGITDLLMKQAMLDQVVETILSQNKESFSALSPMQIKELKVQLISSLHVVMWVFLGYAVILALHVIYTFRLLKKNNHLFAGA